VKMLAYIKSFRNQNYLLPPNLTDLFPKGHVCYLIEQLTDSMNYGEFDVKYAGAGHPAYHPRIMLKLFLMASVDGIATSRVVADRAMRDAVYIYLSERTSPRHTAICDFRLSNKKLIKNVLLQLNTFALEEGLLDLSHLMVDGTTIKANANDDKNISKKTLEKLKRYIDELIEEGIKVDEEENKLYGDRGMHELPSELDSSEKRKIVVQKLVEKINKSAQNDNLGEVKNEVQTLKQKMNEQGVKKYSFTDPDSRFMLNKKGKIQLNYNAQLVVDKNGIIVANDVVQDCDDRHQLVPGIKMVEQQFGPLPETTKIAADGQYLSPDITQLEQFELHIPLYGMQKDGRDRFDKTNFYYDKQADVYICPENKTLTPGRKNKNKIYGHTIPYSTQECTTCPYQKQCAKKKNYRTITATPNDKVFNQIKARLQTPDGKAAYKLRKQTVELAFADIKQNRKLREFKLRGLPKVKTEFNLSCIAHNLVKINNLLKKKSRGITHSSQSLAIAS